MEKNEIKEAFKKVKNDIISINEQLYFFYKEIEQIRNSIELIKIQYEKSAEETTKDKPLDKEFQEIIKEIISVLTKEFILIPKSQQTDQQIIQTDNVKKTTENFFPADNFNLYSPKVQNLSTSIGNKGVPADRQTDQQTDNHKQKFGLKEAFDELNLITKEIRSRFSNLTKQEIFILITLYRLEEQGLIIDYTLLSEKTNLTESSIRDYIQKLIKKDIQLIKTKEKNKKITLKLSPDFKKVVSLNALLTLYNSQNKPSKDFLV